MTFYANRDKNLPFWSKNVLKMQNAKLQIVAVKFTYVMHVVVHFSIVESLTEGYTSCRLLGGYIHVLSLASARNSFHLRPRCTQHPRLPQLPRREDSPYRLLGGYRLREVVHRHHYYLQPATAQVVGASAKHQWLETVVYKYRDGGECTLGYSV